MAQLDQAISRRKQDAAVGEVRQYNPANWTNCPTCGKEITKSWASNFGGCHNHIQRNRGTYPWTGDHLA